jgi:hypothetical protein
MKMINEILNKILNERNIEIFIILNISIHYMAANKAFGQFHEPNSAQDYILNKKAKTTFCGANMCTPSITVNTQGNLLLLKKSNALKYYNCINSFNKANLNINLLTKLEVSTPVLTPSSIVEPNPVPPYLYYTIDPSGVLFGNTPCGLNNYVSFMLYNNE